MHINIKLINNGFEDPDPYHNEKDSQHWKPCRNRRKEEIKVRILPKKKIMIMKRELAHKKKILKVYVPS